MASVWNTLNPLRTGFVKLAPSGKELYGTVIRHGKNPKTVAVRCDFQYWNNKYRKYYHTSGKYLVHDEENYCISGDKVVIHVCRPITPKKHYYVRNIVKAFPRNDYYEPPKVQREENLEREYRKLLKYYVATELKTRFIKNKKQEADIKKSLRAKALAKAIQNIKKLEIISADAISKEAAQAKELAVDTN